MFCFVITSWGKNVQFDYEWKSASLSFFSSARFQTSLPPWGPLDFLKLPLYQELTLTKSMLQIELHSLLFGIIFLPHVFIGINGWFKLQSFRLCILKANYKCLLPYIKYIIFTFVFLMLLTIIIIFVPTSVMKWQIVKFSSASPPQPFLCRKFSVSPHCRRVRRHRKAIARIYGLSRTKPFSDITLSILCRH